MIFFRYPKLIHSGYTEVFSLVCMDASKAYFTHSMLGLKLIHFGKGGPWTSQRLRNQVDNEVAPLLNSSDHFHVENPYAAFIFIELAACNLVECIVPLHCTPGCRCLLWKHKKQHRFDFMEDENWSLD